MTTVCPVSALVIRLATNWLTGWRGPRPARRATPGDPLGEKVDGGAARRGQSFAHRRVADVPPHQLEPPVIADVFQVRLGARPAEGVQDRDQDLGVGPEPVPDEGGPQKSRATGDQKVADPQLAHAQKTPAPPRSCPFPSNARGVGSGWGRFRGTPSLHS